MNHLTDEQFAGWLAGEVNQETQAHLDGCAQCRAEARQLKDGISRYAVALRRQSAQAQRAHLAGTIAPRKALVLHRLRWAGAGVLALVLAAQTAWMLKPRPAPVAPRPVASVPANPQPAVSMSDDELLEAVNNDLSREVPLALAPVSAITTARNKIAAASTDARQGSNQQIEKEGEDK
jgi:hypothetical protein